MESPSDKFGQKLGIILSNTARKIFGSRKGKVFIDSDFISELSDSFMNSDISKKTTEKIMFPFVKNLYRKRSTMEEIRKVIYHEIKKILLPYTYPIEIDYNLRPQVVILCGFNGVGKTSIISKMCYMLNKYSWRTTIINCDSTRKSSDDQLLQAIKKSAFGFVSINEFDGDIERTVKSGMQESENNFSDVLIIDTAGSAINDDVNLKKLEKIVSVVSKLRPDCPHNTILAMDASVGQTAKKQVSIFRSVCDISGVVFTKLDTVDNAGSVISFVDEFKLPIHGVSVGTKLTDLQDFSADEFAYSVSMLK